MKSFLKVPNAAIKIPTAYDIATTRTTNTGNHSKAKPTVTLNHAIIPANIIPDMKKSKAVEVTAAYGNSSRGRAIFFITSALVKMLGPHAATEFVKNVHGTNAA